MKMDRVVHAMTVKFSQVQFVQGVYSGADEFFGIRAP